MAMTTTANVQVGHRQSGLMRTLAEATTRPPALAFGRPAWRGRMHLWAFVAAIPAGLLLTWSAETVAMRAAGAFYSITLLLVFGTSAAYHRMTRCERTRRFMQKLDHSMIYLLIAGTATPLAVAALPRRWGIPFLILQVTLACIGIMLTSVFFERARRLAYALYPSMVATVILVGPLLVDRLTTRQVILMVGGILAYAVGTPVLMRHRPDPWPTTFGYHEIFHVATIVAATLHFVAIRDLVA